MNVKYFTIQQYSIKPKLLNANSSSLSMADLGTTKKAFVIGARETVRGFNLIGVPGKEVNDSAEVMETLEEVLEQDYSVIILSASCTFEIENQIIELRKNVQTPIIIVSDVNMQVDIKQIEKQFRSFVGI